MNQKHVIASIEERLEAWKQLDRAATAAEEQLKEGGQAANTPEFRDLVHRAHQLRKEADREFAAITRAIRIEDTPSSSAGSQQMREGPSGGRELH